LLHEKLQRALKDDEGLFRLPKMKVSSSVHWLVGRLRELVEESVKAAEQGHPEVAKDLNKLVRELCALFSVLRPYSGKGQLKTNPQYCAVFLTDCLYLVHVLILMPYSYKTRLPSDQQQLTFFIDVVPGLRRLGETHFMAMLRHLQEQLAAALRPCDFTCGIARDRAYTASEAAVGDAVQQVKSAVLGMSSTLPTQLSREVAGLMLGIVYRLLLSKLWQVQRAAPEEIACIWRLLKYAQDCGPQILYAAVPFDARDGNLRDQGQEVPGGSALSVVVDLLGSEFLRFLEKRDALLEALTQDEALKLLRLSWREEGRSPEEAWSALRGRA